MTRVRWISAIAITIGIAILGIGGAGVIGHLFRIKALYNWNDAPNAMGLADAVGFMLVGIVIAFIGDALDRLAKALGAD